MSQSVVPATGQERRQAEIKATRDAQRQGPRELDALHTEQGDTTIADGVSAQDWVQLLILSVGAAGVFTIPNRAEVVQPV